MKFNFMKKLFSSLLCSLLVIGITPLFKAAAIGDYLGGSYEDVLGEKNSYKEEHPEDETEYECHHLIAKEALNQWGDEVFKKCGWSTFNRFLVDDRIQKWGPSIIMEKADHEKTLSYYNPKTRTKQQNAQAIKYINDQASRIIEDGDIIGVLRDETDFIRRTFGHKYDRALDEVWEYIRYLKFRHPTPNKLTMTNPYTQTLYFSYDF